MSKLSMLDFLRTAATENWDLKALNEFLGGAGRPNQYIQIGPYDAYLRRSVPRVVTNDGLILNKPLDLANIQRMDGTGSMEDLPKEQRPNAGRRNFQKLIDTLRFAANIHGYDSMYAEQIQNPFLPRVLARKEFLPDELASKYNPDTPSMFHVINRNRRAPEDMAGLLEEIYTIEHATGQPHPNRNKYGNYINPFQRR